MMSIASAKCDSRTSLMKGELKIVSVNILAQMNKAMSKIAALFDQTLPM